jgi:membrane fusion protein (multidrug efflux system)
MAAPQTGSAAERSEQQRFTARGVPFEAPQRSDGHADGRTDGDRDVHASVASVQSPRADEVRDGEDGHAGQDEGQIPENLPRPSTLTVIVVVAVFALLLLALFLIGLIPARHREAQAQSDANEVASDVPVVAVAMPRKSDSARDLIFPCDIHANQATAIYTRATGFLNHWYVDIQDHVKAGQILAKIDAPDLDAQLQQAIAALKQDQANVERSQADLKLAQVTMDRYVESQKVSPGSVTQEQVDQERASYDDAVAALDQTRAAVVQAQASVQQLTAEVGFETVTAPFAGVITARNYDNGAYLSPPTSTTSSREMFDIAQTDLLRVFVSVPQQDATAVQVGKPVYLVVQNYSNRKFQGMVARTSGALDEMTRTLNVELDFPNADGSLYAGMYGQAHVPVSNAEGVLLIPSSALLFNAQGTSVALVRDEKVHIQPVSVGRDLGSEIEVTKGLATGDLVITNPGEKLDDNLKVKVATTTNGKPTGGELKSKGGGSASG